MKTLLSTFILFFLCLNIASAQVYFEENFDNGLTNWSLYDTDNDENNWIPENFGDSVNINVVASSFSFDYGAYVGLTPDNIMTSKVIDLTGAASELSLFFSEYSSSAFPGEYYAVYLTTSNDIDSIKAAQPVFEIACPGGLQNRIIDVSSYSGQMVYLSFRHFNCTDLDFISIDDIVIRKSGENSLELSNVKVDEYGVINMSYPISFEVRNTGGNEISSFSAEWSDGTYMHKDTIQTTLATGQAVELQHPEFVTSNVLETKTISLKISEINYTDINDIIAPPITFTSISETAQYTTIAEEVTGTWCGNCPRGIVALEEASAAHPETFIAISIHSYDPMEFKAYLDSTKLQGAPSMNVNRKLKDSDIDPDIMENVINERESLATPFDVSGTATRDDTTITVEAQTTFYLNNPNADYRMTVILVEDDISSTDSSYAQVNYYSNSGIMMGGYENLPPTVPADQMVYNHVARAWVGGYIGQENSVDVDIVDQATANYTFTYTAPTGTDLENYHAVVLLIDQKTGELLNGKNIDIEFSSTLNIPSTAVFSMQPNAATDYVDLTFESNVDRNIYIYNAQGALMQQTKFEGSSIRLDISSFHSGAYFVSVNNRKTLHTKKLIIE